MDLGSVLGNAATGGVLGGIFSLGNAAVDFVSERAKAKEALQAKKQDHDHELSVLQLTQDRERQIAEETSYQTKLAGTIDEMKASFEGLTASIADQTEYAKNSDKIVSDVLALFRPGLTLTLICGTITFGVMQHQNHFESFVELSAMAVAWWFGDRQRMKMLGCK